MSRERLESAIYQVLYFPLLISIKEMTKISIKEKKVLDIWQILTSLLTLAMSDSISCKKSEKPCDLEKQKGKQLRLLLNY